MITFLPLSPGRTRVYFDVTEYRKGHRCTAYAPTVIDILRRQPSTGAGLMRVNVEVYHSIRSPAWRVAWLMGRWFDFWRQSPLLVVLAVCLPHFSPGRANEFHACF